MRVVVKTPDGEDEVDSEEPPQIAGNERNGYQLNVSNESYNPEEWEWFRAYPPEE